MRKLGQIKLSAPRYIREMRKNPALGRILSNADLSPFTADTTPADVEKFYAHVAKRNPVKYRMLAYNRGILNRPVIRQLGTKPFASGAEKDVFHAFVDKNLTDPTLPGKPRISNAVIKKLKDKQLVPGGDSASNYLTATRNAPEFNQPLQRMSDPSKGWMEAKVEPLALPNESSAVHRAAEDEAQRLARSLADRLGGEMHSLNISPSSGTGLNTAVTDPKRGLVIGDLHGMNVGKHPVTGRNVFFDAIVKKKPVLQPVS